MFTVFTEAVPAPPVGAKLAWFVFTGVLRMLQWWRGRLGCQTD